MRQAVSVHSVRNRSRVDLLVKAVCGSPKSIAGVLVMKGRCRVVSALRGCPKAACSRPSVFSECRS